MKWIAPENRTLVGRGRSIAEFLALRRNTSLLLVALVLAGTGERLWLGFAPKYLQTLGASILIIGLFAALVPLVIYPLFCSSPQVIVGPDIAICLLIVNAVGPLAGNNGVLAAELASVLAILSGLLLSLASRAGLGKVADFLSKPVLEHTGHQRSLAVHGCLPFNQRSYGYHFMHVVFQSQLARHRAEAPHHGCGNLRRSCLAGKSVRVRKQVALQTLGARVHAGH